MEWIYPLVFTASLLLSLLFVKSLKGGMLKLGVGGLDINKPSKPKIPEAGGMLLLPGIWVLVLLLVQFQLINPIAYVFLFTITCFAAVGFFDDGFKLFKKETGWAKYVANRGLFAFLFTLPFTFLILPTLLGLCSCSVYWYAVSGGLLILVTASLANTFAGLNGWEVGSSAIILAGLTVMAAFSHMYTLTLVTFCLIMLGAQLGLFWFNRYPARIFPGDGGTLLMGSFMGCVVLFLDNWYLALGLFAPHIYDLILKLKTNKRDMSQKAERPYVLKNGKIEVPKSGKLDFAKLLVSKLGPMDEKRLVRRIHVIVINNTLFWTLLYVLLEIV